MKNLILATLSILLLSASSFSQSFELSETKKRKNKKIRLIPRFYGKFETKAKLTFDAKETDKFEIRCGAGNLEIQQSKGNNIEIEASIHTTSFIKKHSKRFIEDYLILEADGLGGTLNLKSYFEGLPRYNRWGRNNRMSFWRMLTSPGSKIHLNIKVPENMYVNVNDKSGHIVISDLKNDLRVKDHSGRLTVKNIIGNVKLNDQSGSMEVSNIQGDLDIHDGSGDIALEQIGWDTKRKSYTTVDDRSGKIVVKQIGGDLKVGDLSGSIDIQNVKGDVVVRDQSGSVAIQKVGGALEINDSSGKIDIKEIAYNESEVPYIRINDSSGKVIAENLGTDTYVKDSSGRIIIKKVNGNLEVRDQSGRIVTNEISGKLAIRDSSGRIKANTYMVKNK